MSNDYLRPLPSRPSVSFVDLAAFGRDAGVDMRRVPKSLRLLVETLLRKGEAGPLGFEQIAQLVRGNGGGGEVPFFPSRVVLQDAAGIPLLGDLAAMRTEAARRGLDPSCIEPVLPVDMVIDHSVIVDEHAGPDPAGANVKIEFGRNGERYSFLKWACQAFRKLRVIPPGVGILHQVNLEYLSPGVHVEDGVAYPDSVIGTDSHTVMINGIGVLGWGVGGIEAIAALLGEGTTVPLRQVVAVSLDGTLHELASATDLVLHVTQRLRAENVVGCFVEFVGPGARALSGYDRSTVANMAPEYGATTSYFAVDDNTLRYLAETGRDPEQVELARAYWQAQGMFGIGDAADADYGRTIVIDLCDVAPSVAGPRRPQDRIELRAIGRSFREAFAPADRPRASLGDGAIVLAAITSCTNTANPRLMLAAGLLARNACARGLQVPAHVKASLAPGSRVVPRYLERAGVLQSLDQLGFKVVGFGCMTCVGNSGDLLPEASAAMDGSEPPVVAAVLSGNRNFEGRVHPLVRAAYLMSPPLVVALALAGSVNIDVEAEPLGRDPEGRPVYLRELWPSAAEIEQALAALDAQDYRDVYRDVANEVPAWSALDGQEGPMFGWGTKSSYFREPPFLGRARTRPFDGTIRGRILLSFGDTVTTDHISPVGSIAPGSSAAAYLRTLGVRDRDFNTYGARRCNHDVMVRGTFANTRLKNRMLDGVEGPFTRGADGKVLPVYDVAMQNIRDGFASVVVAGDQYGAGSARDWAAKGTALLGVACVIAVGFERIHRANLVGMGVLPLQVDSAIPQEAIASCAWVDIDVAREAGTARVLLTEGQGATIWQGIARVLVNSDAEWAYVDTGGLLPRVFGKLTASVLPA